VLERRGRPVPSWLTEHDEHGLPTREEIEALAADVAGFRTRPWPMANGLLASLLAWGDIFEFSGDSMREFAQHRAEWVRLLEGASFGPSFRVGLVLERAEPMTPAIGLDRLDDDLVAALRCLHCGAGHEQVDRTLLRCRGCGAQVARTPENAWNLTAPAAPSAAALLFAPAWEEPATWLPVLAAYMEQAGDDATLYLDAAATQLGMDAVTEMVSAACTELSGGRPFPDIVLLAPGEAAPDAARVRSVDELSAALGAHS
jgi:hypothetical protein